MSYSDKERQDFLLGQLAALSSFAQAVLLTHPNPTELRAAFESQLLKSEANTLYAPVTEAYLDGLRFVQASFYPSGTKPGEP